jgi:hypothetical protein
MTKKDKTDKVVRVISRTHVPRDRVNRKKRQDIREKKPEPKEDKPDKSETKDQQTYKDLIEQVKTENQETVKIPATPVKTGTGKSIPETKEESNPPEETKHPEKTETPIEPVEQTIEKTVIGETPAQITEPTSVETEPSEETGSLQFKDKKISAEELETKDQKTYKDLIELVKSKNQDKSPEASEETELKSKTPKTLPETKDEQPLTEEPPKQEKPTTEEPPKQEKPTTDEPPKQEKPTTDELPYKEIAKRMLTEDKENLDEQDNFKKLSEPIKKDSNPKKKRNILLMISIIFIVLIISAAAYSMMTPKKADNYTDFYILNSDGKNVNNTLNLAPNQEGKLIIGLINHEYNKTSYYLVVTSNGTLQYEQNLTLDVGQKLEIPFNFTAGAPGERKMEFKLYKKPENNNIYRYLYLWLNITKSSGEINE